MSESDDETEIEADENETEIESDEDEVASEPNEDEMGSEPDEDEMGSEPDEDEREIEFEGDFPRAEIADHLEAFAGNLRSGEAIEIDVGGQTAVVDPPETVEFEVEIEDEPDDGGVERSVEFELEWMRQESEEPLPERAEIEE